jgi:hypothetical protein
MILFWITLRHDNRVEVLHIPLQECASFSDCGKDLVGEKMYFLLSAPPRPAKASTEVGLWTNKIHRMLRDGYSNN